MTEPKPKLTEVPVHAGEIRVQITLSNILFTCIGMAISLAAQYSFVYALMFSAYLVLQLIAINKASQLANIAIALKMRCNYLESKLEKKDREADVIRPRVFRGR